MESRFLIALGAALVAIVLFGCSDGGNPANSDDACGRYNSATHFCDSRDGQTYRMVEMPDGKTWMAENLNYNPGNAFGSWCYDDNPSNCNIYGRLYDWATAMGFSWGCNYSSCADRIQPHHSGICPNGWRLSTDADWSALEDAVGGSNFAARHLKAQSGWGQDWYSCGPSGSGSDLLCEDTYGFSALPGGIFINLSGGFTSGVGLYGCWWTATDETSEGESARRWALCKCMDYDREGVDSEWYDKLYGYSVRCIRN